MDSTLKLQSYLHASKSAYYSVIMTLPLLILYEILLYFDQLASSKSWQVRNAVDVWIRQLFAVFEMNSQHAFLAMILILLICIPFLAKKSAPLKAKYIGGILLESWMYSLFFGAVVQLILFQVFPLAMPSGSSTIQNFAMSLGAGLFEEFFFRFLLLSVLMWGLAYVIIAPVLRGILAILIAALLFSAVHYIGGLADDFTVYSFLFRFISGLLLTIIYYFRGFAIAVYTHAFYDIWILV